MESNENRVEQGSGGNGWYQNASNNGKFWLAAIFVLIGLVIVEIDKFSSWLQDKKGVA